MWSVLLEKLILDAQIVVLFDYLLSELKQTLILILIFFLINHSLDLRQLPQYCQNAR